MSTVFLRHASADQTAGCTVDGGREQLAFTSVPTITVQAVDTTGAGDTHTGVLAAGLVTELSVLEALRRANTAAAISVIRSGPATAPNRELDQELHAATTVGARSG